MQNSAAQSDNKILKTVNFLVRCHGNGFAYDSRRVEAGDN